MSGSCFTLCSGLALFLYGMIVLSHHLEQLAGPRLQGFLHRMTSSTASGLLLGAGITIALQSSSALTVMLVGLVNAGVMRLSHTIAVIIGSNIGTTLTPWLLVLTGLEHKSRLPELLTPQILSALLALIGVFLVMLSARTTRREAGHILVGFFLLILGMEQMRQAAASLATLPRFALFADSFQNPLLGILAGAVCTGMIQSSAASIGILQAFSLTGSITYAMAIPVIMGQNIGTCITALLSSIAANRNAKQAALLHLFFNLFGTMAGILLLFCCSRLFPLLFLNTPIHANGIALCHTLFNLFTTLLLLPFLQTLERFAAAWELRDSRRRFHSFRK